MKKYIVTIAVFAFGVMAAQEKKDSLNLEKEIEAIELKAQKKLIERKADRLIFNVKDAVSVIGGDATDALKATPGVRIQNEQIQMVGKGSVRVMVNDKILVISEEDLTNYLKSISADNIEKIEVITTPPAKYDAEGNSGLINIQLKSQRSDNWNATLRSSYTQAHYANFNHGVGFNYKKNKLAVLADLGYMHGNALYTNDIHYDYPHYQWHQELFEPTRYYKFSPLLNLTYDISEKSSVGMQFLGGFSNGYTDLFADSYAHDYTQHRLLKQNNTQGIKDKTPQNLSLNLNYTQKLDNSGKKWSIDADIFQHKTKEKNPFSSVFYDWENGTIDGQYARNTADQDLTNYSLKTDVELPLSWATLSTGAKATTTHTKNRVGIHFYDAQTHLPRTEQDDHFEYTETTEALYLSANRSFGEKWEAQAGIRAEATQTKGYSVTLNNTVNRDYIKLFPTLYLLYKPTENHQISLKYNRRIRRPYFQSLNPARWYHDLRSYTTGNPFLQPTFTHSISLDYGYKNWFNASFSYAKIQDEIRQISIHTISNDSSIMRHENYANSSYFSTFIDLNFKPFRWWDLQGSFYAYYSESKPYVAIYTLSKYSGWEAGTQLQNTFTLNADKTLMASAYFSYDFPAKSEGLKTAYSSFDLGIKYLAFNKKLILGLNIEDIFRTNHYTYIETTQGIRQSFAQYYDNAQRIRFSLKYQFGNNKIRLNSHRSGNEEEKNRAN